MTYFLIRSSFEELRQKWLNQYTYTNHYTMIYLLDPKPITLHKALYHDDVPFTHDQRIVTTTLLHSTKIIFVPLIHNFDCDVISLNHRSKWHSLSAFNFVDSPLQCTVVIGLLWKHSATVDISQWHLGAVDHLYKVLHKPLRIRKLISGLDCIMKISQRSDLENTIIPHTMHIDIYIYSVYK